MTRVPFRSKTKTNFLIRLVTRPRHSKSLERLDQHIPHFLPEFFFIEFIRKRSRRNQTQTYLPSLQRHFLLPHKINIININIPSQMQVKVYKLAPTRTIPNSPLPLLHYTGAFPETVTPTQIESKFRSNKWIPQVLLSGVN